MQDVVAADDDDGSCRPSAEVTLGTFGLSSCERTELEAACHVVVEACTLGNSLRCKFVHNDFEAEPLGHAARADELDAIIIAARLPTWSRLQHCDPTGPRALRSRAWQWGFPWLEGEGKAAAELDNVRVHAMMGLVDNFLGSMGAPRPMVLTAPEDLGRVRRAFPASIWQLRRLKAMAKDRHCFRAAFHQCQFGFETFSRPTGVLSNFRLPSRTCKLGWPKHLAAHEFKYSGPLGPTCKCNRIHRSMLKDGGPYRSPERSLSEGTLRWLAATVLSEIIQDKGVGSSRLREGAFYTLAPPNWVPEQTDADSDATLLSEDHGPGLGESDDSADEQQFRRACMRAGAEMGLEDAPAPAQRGTALHREEAQGIPTVACDNRQAGAEAHNNQVSN